MTKAHTNAIGVIVLIVIVGYIGYGGYIKPYLESDGHLKQVTISTMEDLAKKPHLWGRSGKTDGWGNTMQYWRDNKQIIFYSSGPDAEFGNSDDIIRYFDVPKGS